jgi:MOSC domain-containing protein YiiM
VPRLLRDTFGHVDCGIYGEVIEAGPIAVGDAVATG